MISFVHDIKKIYRGKTLSLWNRIILIILVCGIQMIYIPTSLRTTGGVEPKLPIDIFPVWPIWVVPYLLCYPLWLFSLIWCIRKMDDHLFRALLAASFLIFAVSNSIFVFIPTYVKQMTFQGNDIFVFFLRIFHEDTGRYSAFPSGHVYITTLLALFFGRWYPPQKPLWILILIIVSLSTLFTGQHYILDVLGGYAIALAGYYFGLWWAGVLPARDRPVKTQLLLPPPF
ncbi:MAG TPA: phosphatase PAP2 family protein [Anaerolineales bacterium]